MQKLYSAIADSDALVLGSPVYMVQMSAQAKIFTDRLFAYFYPRFSPYFKGNTTKKDDTCIYSGKS
jgi:multimeric flavodoxin WrbA